MRAGIYIRVSTDEQAEEGYSLAAQERACRAVAAARGWEVAGVYADEGVSGQTADRPGLKRLRADVAARVCDVVLVHKTDRLARNLRLTLELVEEFIKHQVGFVDAEGRVDLSSPMGWAMFQLQGVFAELFVRNLKEETAKGLREKAQQGRWVGPVPIGYAKDERGDLLPSPDAPTVRRIYELYTSGQHTYTSIADVLNAEGATTLDWRTGERGRFERESVRTILKNRAYLGYVSSGEVEYKGRHEPLVSEQLWAAATTLRASRTRSHGSPVRTETAWLTERVYCEVCGEKYWHQNSGRHYSVRYYRCCGINKRVCSAPMARAETLEDEVLAILGVLVIPAEQVPQVLAEARRLAGRPAAAPSKPQDEALARKLERLKAAYDDGILTRAEYEKKRREAQATAAAEGAKAGGFDEERAVALLQDLPRLMAEATPAERKAVVGAVFEKIWLEQKVVVALTPRADFGPILVGLALTQYGCLDGVPDGLYVPPLHFIRPGIALYAY